MHVIERGDRVIEDDGRMGIDGCQLGKESRERDASVLTLTQDIARFLIRLVQYADPEERHPLGGFVLAQFDGEASDSQPVHLDGKSAAEHVRDQSRRQFVALGGDAVGDAKSLH